MNRQEQSVLVAGLLAVSLGLAGCRSTEMDGAQTATSTPASTSSPSYPAAVTPSESSSTADNAANGSTASSTVGGSTAGSSASGTAQAPASGTGEQTAGASAALGTPNSTVSKIEIVPRQSSDGSAAGTMAGAAVGGTTAGGSMTDRVYRITLRMDDGSTRVLTQEWAPSFTTGDRVRMSSGAIQR